MGGGSCYRQTTSSKQQITPNSFLPQQSRPSRTNAFQNPPSLQQQGRRRSAACCSKIVPCMTGSIMAASSDKPHIGDDDHVTANGAGTDDNSIQRGCASAEPSVHGEAEHHDSNQNGSGDACASSGPNLPASENGDGEAPTAEGAPDDAKLDTAATDGGEPGTAVAAKKKRKKKSGKNSKAPTALNKIRGTGFEENFADPPMTPAEYQEEQILYDPAKNTFVERIEEGIRRFRGRRRMDAVRTYMFDRYLNLGGIDTSQRQFQGACGLASDALDQLSANEKRLAASNDVIHRRGDDRRYYDPEEEGWHVDFTGVVSCFLSRTLPHDTAGDPEYIAQGADLILNWLNYLTHHNICPEHAADLARAREVCAAAKAELPDISAALAAGMGQFNYACRAIFGLAADAGSRWVDRIDLDPAADADAGPLDWPLVFCATMALLGNGSSDDDDAARAAMSRWATADPTLKHHGGRRHGRHEFIFDHAQIARRLRSGMKMRLETAEVTHPDFRLKFVSQLVDIVPSFYTFLPQELMVGFKEPIECDRDPSSVDNPGGKAWSGPYMEVYQGGEADSEV
ncbi:hypothetical protein MAPG_11415 [Magnaporthiopsis poae ATCC 64411]|uniref:Argonaute-binding protein 1 n=1 Tax=Magnaporthiopsis poae (strain ATCC 64411 / 73-15) TaxID=644358 RepID=A0A0C4EF76_MAGP6|nr:hypothetical protein MAPG_11415 [Magnaporthiopsis poae ATCC 64411]